MRPCFREAVKIATVVAAHPRAALMPAAPRLRRRGQAWFEHRGMPASGSCGTPVSVRPAVSGWAGDGVRGRVQVRGGWVIFGALTGELACSAVLAHVLVGRRGTRAVRACGGAVAQQVGSFVGSYVVKIYSKKLDYQSGRPDLNRRPLDPQSRSRRRWTSPGVAQWALDQA